MKEHKRNNGQHLLITNLINIYAGATRRLLDAQANKPVHMECDRGVAALQER